MRAFLRMLFGAVLFLAATGTTTIISPTPVLHFTDNNGFNCYNCELFTYAGGTTSKLNTYTDSTGGTPNLDPIILNARGEANVWLSPGVAYKFVLAPAGSSDPPTAPIYTVDNILESNLSSICTANVACVSLIVPTNVALQAQSTVNSSFVTRAGFYKAGDSPPVLYTAATGACSIADNGTCNPSSDGNSWVAKPSDPKDWGATGSASQTTCSIASTATAMTLAASGDFQNGDPIFCQGAGATVTLNAPSLAVAPTNGTGTTTYYSIRPLDAFMGVGAAITPVSVSGGAILGTPLDLKSPLTGISGTTHGTTTLDSITFPGGGCTSFATCDIVIGSYVTKADVTPGTTISAFPTATSITLSATATGSAAGTISASSPLGGVYNTLTITGSAAGGFAIYGGGASNTPSAMTCIGWTSYRLGPWIDRGHPMTCPTWIPATADIAAVNDALRTTIVSGAGTTALVVHDAALNTVAGAVYNVMSHDDSAAIASAITSALPIKFSPGTYNQLVGATIASDMVIDGQGGATIASWGPLNNFTAASGSDQHILENINFSDAQKSIGLDMNATQSSQFLWQNIDTTAAYSFFAVTRALNARFRNLYSNPPINGDYCAYFEGSLNDSPSTFVNNPQLSNVTCGTGYHNYGFLADGDVDSVTMESVTLFPSPFEWVEQNTVGGSTGPNLGRITDAAINNAWGVPMQLLAKETGYKFNHLYIQGIQGNNHSCLYLGTSAEGSIGGNSSVFGCDLDGIEDHAASFNVDNSTLVYANNQLPGGTGDKVRIASDAIFANIQLANGDRFSSESATPIPLEKCGVEIISGAGGATPQGFPPISVTDTGPGYQAPVCDRTGVYGQVQVNGLFNSPTWDVCATGGPPPTSCTLLTTAEMLGNQNNTMPTTYMSGNIFGTGVTVTTPTATALISSIGGAITGTMFNWQEVNLGGSVVTLVGGTGVTVTTAGTNSGVSHVYRCVITNVGSNLLTCAG